MRMQNVAIGIIWLSLSYVPITAWYGWRRVGIRQMRTENKWYHIAWNVMWMSHYFIFQLPAIVFPLTFLGSQTINHFYILLNYYVGTIVGGVAAATTVVFFIIAAFTYTAPADGPALQIVVAELFLYMFATFGVWSIAVEFLVPGAYEWLQLSVVESEKVDFKGASPEGSEQDGTISILDL